MKLIPVVDLKDGLVVHAREGRRDEYQPVRSKLCTGAQPEAVIEGLLDLYPFRTLYVADLDAIQRRGSHAGTLAAIRRRFPDLELWVDSGIADEEALGRWIEAGIGTAVIGSESLAEAEFVSVARSRCGALSPVLSLDFVGEAFKGPPALLAQPRQFWPSRVLAMNLRRVGGTTGPDVALVARLGSLVPGVEVFAAGGVRSTEDLARLATAGAAGALIASALHDGRLAAADLARYCRV